MRIDDFQSERAGRCVLSPEGGCTFLPKALPPDPVLCVEGAVQEVLDKALYAMGQLEGCVSVVPDVDRFVAMYMRREALLSSEIEGTQSSLQEVVEAEKGAHKKTTTDTQEVINYLKAMQHGLKLLLDLPVSKRLICELHGLLLKDVRGSQRDIGHFRRGQVWIGAPGCEQKDAKFVPPPPGEVAAAFSDLEKFYHSSIPLHPLIKIGLIHAQFESIHPFNDGNGRLGRMLISFFLCEQKILSQPVLYLSYFFRKNRPQYYTALREVSTHGAWESWIEFFLQGLYEVSQHTAQTAKKLQHLRLKHHNLLSQTAHTAKSYRVLEKLYQMPIVSVGEVQQWADVSFSTANSIVKHMVQKKILCPCSSQTRHRRFIYTEYMDLFKT